MDTLAAYFFTSALVTLGLAVMSVVVVAILPRLAVAGPRLAMTSPSAGGQVALAAEGSAPRRKARNRRASCRRGRCR